jgi:endonuclease/exonuclease/phosphatase family metal-dependent hydrolase
MKKLNWFQKLAFIINIGIALLLLMASFSSVFEPKDSSLIYLMGLTYPFLLLTNIIFIGYWIYKGKLVFIISLGICLIGSSNFNRFITFNSNPTKSNESTFKIMSFNVRLFNRYKWIKKERLDTEIMTYIQSESPDIISFQEFINVKKEKLNYINQMKEIGYPYYKLESRTKKYSSNNFFGLITFSKYKIKNSGAAYQNPNGAHKTISLFTDIEINDQLVRIYNTHFNSLKFISTDYDFVENIADNNETEALKKSKNILSKVMASARIRQDEIAYVKEHISNSPYPIIMVGDFNEPPYSYAYPQFTSFLSDPFLKHGFGLGTTYDGISTIPGLRLDYILHSDQLESTHFYTGQSGLSDHRPVIAEFILKQ